MFYKKKIINSEKVLTAKIVTGISIAGAPVLIVMVWGIAKSFTENVTDTQVRYCLQLGECVCVCYLIVMIRDTFLQ